MRLSPAEKMRRYREKNKQKDALEAQGVAPEAAKVAADKIVEATQRAEADGRLVTIGHAFMAGYYARVFTEVTAGNEDADHELRGWHDGEPECLWLFEHYVSVVGLWEPFESWRDS